jgi:hypothetical protein
MKETPETTSHDNELTYLAMNMMSATMRMRMLIWAPAALPIGFTELRYPKDSSYLMITDTSQTYL